MHKQANNFEMRHSQQTTPNGPSKTTKLQYGSMSGFNGLSASGKYPKAANAPVKKNPFRVTGTPVVQKPAGYQQTRLTPQQIGPSDVSRQLRHEVERLRDENEDVKEQLAHMTQMFLRAKAENEQLAQRNGRPEGSSQDLNRHIEKQVKRMVEAKEKENLAKIAQQQKKIVKLQNLKVCLSKNVFELQDRLKVVKDELGYTQKQLIWQANPDAAPLRVGKQSSSQDSAKSSAGSRKSNKVIDVSQIKAMLPTEEPARQRQLARKEPVFRSGMNVAKSLAVERNGGMRDHLFGGQNAGATRDEKYAFLFEDDDGAGASSRRGTNRQMIELQKTQIETEPDSCRGLNVSAAKMLADSSTVPSTIKKREKTMEQNFMNEDELQFGDRSFPGRKSIVQKSLQSVKGFFMRAAEGFQAAAPNDGLRLDSARVNLDETDEPDLRANPFRAQAVIRRPQIDLELSDSMDFDGQERRQEQAYGSRRNRAYQQASPKDQQPGGDDSMMGNDNPLDESM